MPEQNTDKEESAVTIMNEDGSTTTSATANNNNTRYYSKERQLKTRLSNDVAASPPPCNGMSGSGSDSDVVRMAYYAYNPNARFRRSNPGMPDFGVAVMPFHSSDNSDNNSHDTNGPTFDVLQSLVAACEGKGRDDQLLLNNNEDDGSDNGGGSKRGNENGSSTADNNTTGIPLRVVTVADSGAVIAFGVTNGDVPSINN